MIRIIVLITLLCSNIILSQSINNYSSSNYVQVNSIETILTVPKFDIHIAAGFSAGVRAGFRYLFTNNFSTEIAFGYDIKNFFVLSDLQRRYTLGINYNLENSNGAFSLLATYVEQPNSVREAILFSPGFGFIPIRESGVKTFFRFGIGLELRKIYPSGKWKYQDITPNLDLGVSFNF